MLDCHAKIHRLRQDILLILIDFRSGVDKRLKCLVSQPDYYRLQSCHATPVYGSLRWIGQEYHQRQYSGVQVISECHTFSQISVKSRFMAIRLPLIRPLFARSGFSFVIKLLWSASISKSSYVVKLFSPLIVCVLLF